ncbi:hypothetical protein FNV43_RR15011 [Rhamnella rubrinervis]|uniref:Uncharacterized protein n=1 Tax=Rhamnella rubrinervis TaxID=2594499 RepID=A0A8K0GWV3_9ROSA|nr:hypothetical protein FNV43_RR15011 [Rhamnella rubrinervis]
MEDLRDRLRRKAAKWMVVEEAACRYHSYNPLRRHSALKAKSSSSRDLKHSLSRREALNLRCYISFLPKTFKMPNLVIYDGSNDPNDHVNIFKSWMDFEHVSKLERCRAFPLTLAGPIKGWHSRLS